MVAHVRTITALSLVVGLGGCPAPASEPDAGVDAGGLDAGDRDAATSLRLSGAVEKGPFVTGSSVHVGVLDPTLVPVGTVFDTTTRNDLGEFELLLPSPTPVQIEGDGFYYNEALGALSTSRIVLRALFVPDGSGAVTAYVNMVTHVTQDRVRALVRSGATFSDATAQAEGELRVALGITAPGFVSSRPGTAMTITGGDDDDNAYLFAVSTVLAHAALARGGAPDANLQELLNALTLDLADGALTPALADEIRAALPTFRTGVVEERFAARLAAIGSGASVPDLDRVLDQDRDGIVNRDDDCPLAADPDQADGDGDGIGDACDDCPATACPDGCVPATARTPDLCVERCGEGDPCAATGDLCVEVGHPRDASTCAGIGVCASACDPLGASTCGDDETCELVLVSGDTREHQWRCVPATPGADAGQTCSGGIIEGGCAHGLVCDGGSRFAVNLSASCLVFPLGVCRAPCNEAAPSCGVDACEARDWPGAPTPAPGVCATAAIPLSEGDRCYVDGVPCAAGLACTDGFCTAV